MVERDSHANSDDAGAWRLTAFFVPLPEPLPVAHGTTHTKFFDEVVPPLQMAAGSRPTEEAPPFPDEFAGQQFVSLKFWQVVEPVAARYEDSMTAAWHVVTDVVGRPASTEGKEASQADGPTTYRTVAEMVTMARVASDSSTMRASESAGDGDPFMRCFNFLQEILRAYRLSEGVLIPELTYERLPPYVLFCDRDPLAEDQKFHRPLTVMFLHNLAVADTVAPPSLNQEQLDRMHAFFTHISKGHPLIPFAERSLQARVALEKDGNYVEAVIQCALAAEVLLDGVLSLMLWEEAMGGALDVRSSAEVLARPLATKVRREYHPRLGGTWDVSAAGPVRSWSVDVARVRGRVLHRGYRPGAQEARAALDACQAIEGFVKERLAKRVRSYKRTALLMLGRPDLQRHGAWSKVEAFVENIDSEPNWVDSYRDWREQVDNIL